MTHPTLQVVIFHLLVLVLGTHIAARMPKYFTQFKNSTSIHQTVFLHIAYNAFHCTLTTPHICVFSIILTSNSKFSDTRIKQLVFEREKQSV
jgi:hypothetical protein